MREPEYGLYFNIVANTQGKWYNVLMWTAQAKWECLSGESWPNQKRQE